MLLTRTPKNPLYRVARLGWSVYKKYFSEVGYITRALNYFYCSLNQRHNIALRKKKASGVILSENEQNIVDALRTQGGVKAHIRDFGFGDDFIETLRERTLTFGEKSAAEIKENRPGYSKTYWDNILVRGEKHYDALMAFACNRDIVSVAAKYLGQVPTLQDVSFYYSPPDPGNTRLIGSQGWHRDNEQKTKLKIFLSPYVIGSENGPTTYLPAPYSNPSLYKNYPDYFDDTQAAQFGVSLDHRIAMIANPGEFYFADTSRVFHYGARNQTRPRWLVIITYGPVESHLWPSGWRRFYKKGAQFTEENKKILDQFNY